MRDFLLVASEIVHREPALASCRPVIEKELLHFEILGAMNDAGLLRHLVFKGGTCLRLCYGGVRFSEDLDFSGGAAFNDVLLRSVEEVLRGRIGRSYGLQVTVKPPRKVQEGQTREISRWVARVITRPAESAGRLGVQRIKIEIDRRVHASEDLGHPAVQQRYGLLADYFTPFPVRAASFWDICTDKMIAFPFSVLTRDNPRHRDVWDIEWINRRVNDIEGLAARASQKAIERGVVERYAEALDTTLDKGKDIIASKGFLETLQRFIPKPLATRTIANAGYREHLVSTIESLCSATLRVLRH